MTMAETHKHGKGFTLIELLVVIGIIAILMGILLPVLSKVRVSANRTACRAALRDIGMRYLMYMNDSRNRLPFVNSMPSQQPPLNNFPSIVTVLESSAQGSPKSYRCPADRIVGVGTGVPAGFNTYFDRETTSYEYNTLLGNLPYAGIPIGEFQRSPMGQTLFPNGKPTLLWILKDFAPFHGTQSTAGAMNYLFWDFRVGDVADELKP